MLGFRHTPLPCRLGGLLLVPNQGCEPEATEATMPLYDKAETVLVTPNLRVNVVLINDDLGLQVQMKGVQVFRVVLLRAATTLPKARLDQYARVAPDLGFEIGNVFEQIETANPQ